MGAVCPALLNVRFKATTSPVLTPASRVANLVSPDTRPQVSLDVLSDPTLADGLVSLHNLFEIVKASEL